MPVEDDGGLGYAPLRERPARRKNPSGMGDLQVLRWYGGAYGKAHAVSIRRQPCRLAYQTPVWNSLDAWIYIAEHAWHGVFSNETAAAGSGFPVAHMRAN